MDGNTGQTPLKNSDEPWTATSTRSSVACVSCRQAKVRCNVASTSAQASNYSRCSRCIRLGQECVVQTPVRRAGGRKVFLASGNGLTPDRQMFAAYSPVAEPAPPALEDRSPSSFTDLPNPLGLLAGASQVAAAGHQESLRTNPSPQSTFYPQNLATGNTSEDLHLSTTDPLPIIRVPRHVLNKGLEFLKAGPSQPCHGSLPGDHYFAEKAAGSTHRDVGHEYDPVAAGLVKEQDLDQLFDYFFNEIHPLAPTLDPVLTTPRFARRQSSLLLTAIALVAAQSMADREATVDVLSKHASHLLDLIFKRNLSSLEIVQGINVLAIWPRSAARADEDQQGRWLNFAIGMILDLRLDSVFEHNPVKHDTIRSRAPSLEPLETNGNGNSEYTARAARARERSFIAVFVWDRSFALATGRSWTFPDSSVMPALHGWDKAANAHPDDAHLLDVVSLRLECSKIRTAVVQAQKDQPAIASSKIPRLILDLVHERIDTWKPRLSILEIAGWPSAYKQALCINLIHAETRVWALGLGLPYHCAEESYSQLRTQCWEAALRSCELIVLHESSLRNLSASIALMITYGALLTLSLYPIESRGVPRAAIIGLIGQVSRFLVDSGSQPAYRNGPNAIYGHQLLRVLRSHLAPVGGDNPTVPLVTNATISGSERAATFTQEDTLTRPFSNFNETMLYPWPPSLAATAGLGLDTAEDDGLASWSWLLSDPILEV